jgi:RNase P subunit RPR2
MPSTAPNPSVKKRSANGPRIVTLDIETAPIESYHWGLWDQNIGLEQIKTEWTILSFSAKWLGTKGVIYKHTGGRGAGKVRDDLGLLKELWSILDEADIVIAQNGQAFDIKKINSRMLMANFKPYSPIKVIDTMLVAKRHFSFTSNKLKWLSGHLTDAKKSEHKLFPGFELWAECLKDNPKAWKEMEKYNCIDVLATEELYLKLRPWIEGHVNVAAYSEMEEMACPKCGSSHVQKRGRAFTQTGEYVRFQCQDCGGWARSRYTINTSSKRKSLLSN